MAWVRAMNSIRNRAEEIVLEEIYIDNILPDFIFVGVRLSRSGSSISCVGKKDNNFALNAIDIFADDMVYYIID